MSDMNDLLTDAERRVVAEAEADEAAEVTAEEVTLENEAPAPLPEPAPSESPQPTAEVHPEASAPQADPLPPTVDAGLYQQANEVLGQIEQRLVDLEAQYESGELSFKEFRATERTLLRHQREAEGVIQQAQIEARVTQATVQREWSQAVAEFRKDTTNQAFESPLTLPMMEAALHELRTQQPNLPAKDQLAQAKLNVQTQLRTLLGLPADAALTPKAAGAKPSIKAPPVLSIVPMAENNAIGEFAALDRLVGLDYEKALGKLTPDQQQRYLAA